MHGVKTSDSKVREIIRLFPYHTNKELMEMTGVSHNTISRLQKQYHLRKSKEHIHNVRHQAGNASMASTGGRFAVSNTPEIIARRVETYNKKRKLDIIRVKWGLEPLTNIRLPHGCTAQRDQVKYLRNRGYIIDDPNKIAYYTPDTFRCPRLETIKRGEKTPYMHCFFDFKPLNEAAERERGQSGETQASR